MSVIGKYNIKTVNNNIREFHFEKKKKFSHSVKSHSVVTWLEPIGVLPLQPLVL